jgi:hypothetical protein
LPGIITKGLGGPDSFFLNNRILSKMSKTQMEDGMATSFEKGEYVENIEHQHPTTDEIINMSGIENEATSKAAWLISLTVSIGGFLFGKSGVPHLFQYRCLTIVF